MTSRAGARRVSRNLPRDPNAGARRGHVMKHKPKLKVRQLKSAIGCMPGQRATLRGLGLRGPNSTVTVANTPAFRGAVKKVLHLVSVEESDV